MLIEYKIKFRRDGLAITQRVDSSAQTPPVKFQGAVEQNVLRVSFTASQQANASNPQIPATASPATAQEGGAPVSNPKNPGGSPLESSSGPITIIGPFLFLCPPHNHDEKANHDK